MNNIRALVAAVALCVLCVPLVASNPAEAQPIEPSDRGAPWIDLGRVDSDRQIEDAIVSIPMRAGAAADLDLLLRDQQDPASSRYHQWLTPETFGDRFGATVAEVDAIVAALRANGLRTTEIAKSRTWVRFSGSTSAFEAAFGAPIHAQQSGSETRLRFAATTSAKGTLSGVDILLPDDLRGRSTSRQALPQNTLTDGSHGLAPGDWATIYNVNPIYQAGYRGGDTNGSVSIAVVGQSDIDVADVQMFRTKFGLPANDPTITHVGAAPGKTGDEGEGDLDVEWAGAIAPLANIRYYVAAAAGTAALQAVNDNLSSIISVSYGRCESQVSTATANAFDTLWKLAASNGISVFVSSGDSGPSDCDQGTALSGTGTSVNVYCTPNVTCVGGTQFDDTASPSTYWSSSNDPTTLASARSYIPEIAWNESGPANGGWSAGLWASGGGSSVFFARPSWQVGPGVPGGSARLVPDIAASAAGHDYYFVYMGGKWQNDRGTSAAAPSVAGMVALVGQRYGRLGLLNPALYYFGSLQYSGGTQKVFHDVTRGNNNVPGVTGYNCGTGYDLVTGLGSLDASAFFTAMGTLASCSAPSITAQPQPVKASGGTATVSVTASGTAPLTYQWYVGSSGNTSTPIPNATLANQGLSGVTSTVTVWVRVSNGCGSVDSNATTITVSGGPTTCTPNATTACVLNNRFQVKVRYRGAFDNNAADTDALVKLVNGFANPAYETAFFYFNSQNNIEMLIKMLDQGNTNGAGQPTIAVLFGSATPLRIELTITDTQTGLVKRYTSQYGSQTGSTDFTAFVK